MEQFNIEWKHKTKWFYLCLEIINKHFNKFSEAAENKSGFKFEGMSMSIPIEFLLFGMCNGLSMSILINYVCTVH